MRILAIGDFHGKVPTFLKKVIRKEKPDLIVSPGDYFPFQARALFFKYCYKQCIELYNVIGKKKCVELDQRDIKDGEKVLKYFNSLNTSIITTTGNREFTTEHDDADYRIMWKTYKGDVFRKIVKNFKDFFIVNYKTKRIGGFAFIGHPKSSSPGRVKSQRYNFHKRKLEKQFKRWPKEEVIFVAHNPPYNIDNLDLIHDKKAHKLAKGKHFGSKLAQRIIKKYQPLLCICGHMHENQGVA